MRKVLLPLLATALFLSPATSKALPLIVVPPEASHSGPGDPDPKSVKSAIEELKNLSGKEKRERIKEAKKELKKFKADKKSGKEPSTNTVLLCILAVLLPPLAVYLHEGEINNRFWISVLLTLLLILPGIIYALIIVLGD